MQTSVSERVKKLAGFGYACGLTFWSILTYSWLFVLFAQKQLFAFNLDGRPYVNDFVNVYNASLLARACAHGTIDIYDPQVQLQSFNPLVAPVVPELPFYLQYPPHFFLIARPLAGLGLSGAYLANCFLGLVGIMVSLYLLDCFKQKGLFSRWSVTAGVLSAYPAWVCFRLGQPTLFVLPLLTSYWWLLRAKRYLAAGMIAGLLSFKLQYAPITILLGIAIGSWRFAAGVASSLVVLLVSSGLLLGWNNVSAYPNALVMAETMPTISGLDPQKMENLRGALVLWLGGETTFTRVLSLLAFGAAAIAAVVCWRRVVKTCPGLPDRKFEIYASVSTLALLITSLHAHIQDYLLVAIPAVWLWQSTDSDPAFRPIRILVAVFPVLSWLCFLFAGPLSGLRVHLCLAWAIALLALLLLKIFSNKSNDTDA